MRDSYEMPSSISSMPEIPQDNAPLLTIAIPTYNRARYLEELLSSLAPQLRNQPQIELIISDNCSSDDTPEIVLKYARQGLAISSIRNQANIGPDPNFIQCFELARGRYFWLIGDDEILIPGAIDVLLPYLRCDLYDMIYVNQFPVKDLGMEPEPVRRCSALTYTSARDYASRIGVFFTFISANIIRKETALRAPPAKNVELVGTYLVQLSWVYSALNETRRALSVETPLIGARVDNASGYGLFEVFGPRLSQVTRTWVRDSHISRIIENSVLSSFLPGFSYKSRGDNNPFDQEDRTTTILTPVFRDNPRYWLCVYPILVLPRMIAWFWYGVIRVINRLQKITRKGKRIGSNFPEQVQVQSHGAPSIISSHHQAANAAEKKASKRE